MILTVFLGGNTCQLRRTSTWVETGGSERRTENQEQKRTFEPPPEWAVEVSLVGDTLYLTDQSARTHVFEPADVYRPLHTNVMAPGERTNSTLAFADGQLFLRTFNHLYALAARAGDTD